MGRSKLSILGISGSPRKAATDFVVRKALEYAEKKFQVETDYFHFYGKKINFCLHCDYCIRTRKGCIQKDDMTEVYAKLEEADTMLFGTPVYNGTLSGQLKTLFDRCRALVAKNPKALKNKVGAGIAVGGDRVGGQELALLTIHSFFLIHKMIPVSGGALGANLGGIIWSKDRGAKGAEEDTEGFKSVYKTVDRLVETTMLLRKI
ncbi:MAG: flavodoxin family protein [Nitrososphaerales archaeon]|nr:flavodoxin family protein [Nitrososphaerales archaeon]